MPIESSIQTAHSDDSRTAKLAEPSDWNRLSEAGTIESYCASWLRIQSQWLGGVERAVVCRRMDGSASIEVLASMAPDDYASLGSLVEATLGEGLGLAGPLGDVEGRHGVSHFAELSAGARLVVAVEVETSEESDLAVVLRQLQWGSIWLERPLSQTSEEGRGLPGPPSSAQARQLLDLIAIVLEARGFAAACQSLTTELARLLACDRVSLGVEQGGHVRLAALSHSAAFGREMNLVRDIEAAMAEARDQHACLVHPAPDSDRPPMILREHEALAREQGAGSVLTIPVQRTGALPCALTFEHSEVGAFSSERIETLETALLAVAPILELWRREDRSLPAKAAEAGREQLERLIGPGYFARKLVLAIVGVLFLFFSFAKGEYRIGSEGTLEGASRRVVIAPFDGYVAEALRRAGDSVVAGELLAKIDDRELELERLKWASRLIQLERQSDESRAAREYGRTSILSAQTEEARAELARLEERLDRTRITAAFDGLVVSGDLSQSLGGAVSRGDVLFEIAPLEHYRILLDVDEEQIADVSVGQHGTLLLAAVSDSSFDFEVTKVTPVATAEDGRNFFRVEGTLAEISNRLRPGMEGVGKISVDERRLIWIWTRSFQSWLRLWVWSWWP